MFDPHGFFVYLHTTRNMTVERNANYVADAASQTAKRIDDLLVGAENSISAIAHMYEQSLFFAEIGEMEPPIF